MDTKSQPPDTTTSNKILVNVLLDRSGSMETTKRSTVEGYNEYIQNLRADKDTDYSISLVQFDAPMTNPELTVTYMDRALADVPALTEDQFLPRGNTPLYDAIGESIRRVEANGRAVIILIITDGQENASTEFNKDSVKALIKTKESEGWTFAFLGANIDSYATGAMIGMPMANTANYVAGNERALYTNLASATMARSSAIRTVGAMAASAQSFLTDDHRNAMSNNTSPSSATTTTTTKISGGRPTAPPNFRQSTKNRVDHQRKWSVTKS